MFYKLTDIDLAKTTPEEIGEILIEAKKAYYTTGKPVMDDATYDTLEDILQQKLPYHRLFSKVGTPIFNTGFEKKPHTIPMGSQNKVKTLEELKKYFDRQRLPTNTQFVVQDKLDGISIELVYGLGKFTEAITRGDGLVGDVITQNVTRMRGFVEKIEGFSGSIRCEILITIYDFKKELKSEEYTNPRNAASGISQRLDSKYSNICTLTTFDIVSSTKIFKTESEKEQFAIASNLSFVPTSLVQSYEEIQEVYKSYLQEKRALHGYEIDGLVIKINDTKISDSLGLQNNRPMGQVAYKFPSQSLESKVVNITWQVGPLGTITPVAQIEPVEVAGAIITFASLANHDLIVEKNLNIGDIVEISRRGDVIPYIERVVVKVESGHIPSPTTCPSCGSTLIKDNKYLKCKNSVCPAQVLGTLNLFCNFLDIKNISDKTIKKLNDIGKLSVPGDFYKLNSTDIAPIDGLGELSAKNILDEINAKRNLTLEQIFTAAAIPDFSQKRIRQLISAGFNNPEKLLYITKQELLSQSGIQENLAARILAGLSQRRENILSILSQVILKEAQTKNILHGSVFCITGSLAKPRKQIEENIVSSGGRVANTVSKNTSYLVTNEPDSGSSKLEQATRFGTKIISEQELYNLLNA